MAKSTTDTEEIASTDVAVVSPNGLDLAKRKEEMQAQLAATIAEMKSDDFDPEQLMLDVMEAQTIDDILGDSVVHMKEIIGTPMTVHSAQLQNSGFEESAIPAYAVMRVQFDDGRRAVVTCGALQVVMALIAAQKRGFFPFRCSSVMVTSSKGNDVIRLTAAPPPQF